jgi:transposase InsO family protein
VLLELSVVEQRYDAVMEILRDGLSVTEVAERYGVSRQSIHAWITRYEHGSWGASPIVHTDRSRAPTRTEGLQVVRTPIRAPRANAICERWIRTVRTECLDWLLIFSRRHLERVLRVYVRHYNRQRPHRALQLQAPEQEEFERTRFPLTQRCVGEIDPAGCCPNTMRRRHDGTEFVHPSARPAVTRAVS